MWTTAKPVKRKLVDEEDAKNSEIFNSDVTANDITQDIQNLHSQFPSTRGGQSQQPGCLKRRKLINLADNPDSDLAKLGKQTPKHVQLDHNYEILQTYLKKTPK